MPLLMPTWILLITAVLFCITVLHIPLITSLVLSGIAYLSYVWLLGRFVIKKAEKAFEPDWGLHQFYPAQQQESNIMRSGWLNVVFVHGLASNPATTWTARSRDPNKKEQVDWISNFLQPDLCTSPKVEGRLRMFYFSYESTWMSNASDARLREFGMTLRRELSSILSGEDDSSRLLLVGHSFGGLVIKEALRSLDPRGILIPKKIAGIIFLGTPHRGSDFAWIGLLIGLMTLPFDSNLSIIRNILYDSKGLADLHEDFLAAFGSVPLRNFYEARKARVALGFLPLLNQYVVPEESATFSNYGDTSKFRCNTDHTGLNKFHSRTKDYGVFRAEMLSLLVNALGPERTAVQSVHLEVQPANEHWGPYINPPCTEQMKLDFEEASESRHPRTCHWIKSNKSFTAWKQRTNPCILWMTGNLGSGKTVLATYLIELFRQEILQKETPYATVVFALCNHHTLRHESEILRSAITQILDEFPQIKTSGFEDFWSALQSSPKAIPTPSRDPMFKNHPQYALHEDPIFLWNIFFIIISHLPTQGLVFVVDGLDHLQKSSSKTFLAQLRDRLSKFDDCGIKFVFTSRPDEHIRENMDKFPRGSYERLHAEQEENAISNDIGTYLEEELIRIGRFRGYADGQVIRALKRLRRDSEDMFLYARLAVERLTLTSSFELDTVLDAMPKGLDAMYEQVLMDISPEIRSRQSKILLCLMYTYRPLRLVELESAMSFSNRTRWPRSSSDAINVAGLRKDLLLYGPLIRYREAGGTVHLVHQGAGEYLRKQANKVASDHHPFLTSLTKAHEYLAIGCLQYLLRYSNLPFPYPWEWGFVTKVSMLHKKYLLLDYALNYWHLHCAEALKDPFVNSETGLLPELLRKFDRLRQHGGHDMLWFNALRNPVSLQSKPGGSFTDFRNLSSLEFFSAIGLSSFVDNILRKEGGESSALMNRKHQSALTLAISRGHSPVVNLIVQHFKIMNLKENAYKSAISDAAWANNHDLVRKLLILRPNRSLEELSEALYAAVETGNPETAETVLAVMDVRERDRDGMTVLHRLFSNKFSWSGTSNAAVQLLKAALLLIGRGADINAQDNFGNTVLHYVCYSYMACLWCVAKLVKEGADPAISNKAGWLPMHLAARRSQDIATLNFLEKCRPRSVFALTRGGYNPLHWAANRGGLDLDVGVLRWLLRKGLTLDSQTRAGETPLSLIIQNPKLRGALQQVHTWVEGFDYMMPSLTVKPFLRRNSELEESGFGDSVVVDDAEIADTEIFDGDESKLLSQAALLQMELSKEVRIDPTPKTRLKPAAIGWKDTDREGD